MNLALPEDFKEFLRLLNLHAVEYLLIGGYAVALHGHVRYTKDIDLWIALHPDNLNKLRKVLYDFGFPTVAETLQLEAGEFLQLGLPPFRIELLTVIDGVEFHTCYKHRELVELDELSISLIDLASLRQNKAASGRLQDLADLERLPES